MDSLVCISCHLDAAYRSVYPEIQYIVSAGSLRHCRSDSFASFIPIVALALVFNITNVIGFTYAYVLDLISIPPSSRLFRDRDAKQRWASSVVTSNWNLGFGGIGGQILTGAVKKGVAKVFS